MVLSQKSIDAFDSFGQLLLDKDISITIIHLLPFYETKYHALSW